MAHTGLLPRFVHFVFGTSTADWSIPSVGVCGTLTYDAGAYSADFTVYHRSPRGGVADIVFPVTLSLATMQEWQAMLFGMRLRDDVIPEWDWARRNLLRCFALSTPLGHKPGVFEFRSVWHGVHNAPWDCLHYSGWARDPEYGRENNPVWSVIDGVDQAFSFLVDALGIRDRLGGLGLLKRS